MLLWQKRKAVQDVFLDKICEEQGLVVLTGQQDSTASGGQ